ncbi:MULTISPECIES: putative bifunctional diguanylate cyclase/phosphodiesterase [Halomonadaceae]|uniref:cyclic-guanylate-specific phosphodiesterase n=1 Tax=Vreelandella titanicae TaxID=664683 RepID=A0A653X6P2_9GAMM|nr:MULTISPECIES: GGDEF domain-containing phosphodiesterase [Halomonas]UEQ03269.1 EAL domain-containing protein [Halomonas profundus]QKS25232.1 putative signaling protein [Halomonas titanicae]CAD5256638.1 Diguanylate cyclase/phosphodiesterase with PAS/PAC sensor(S) [Halomonas sp. 59]CAD5256840.1 Diguanylate cyclase/phosphodiesterase with PAS/PAC sensor(S) [Halomonas sp. 113]CAD5270629.1 Diguanylate cyclase/phosphodiesterase with PAS/PAC sensor(S) [Halomonas sp. I3]
MKSTQSLLMVFLLPILMVVLPALLMLTIAMKVLEEQSQQSNLLQTNDLDTLVQMATFDRQLSDLHQRITALLIDTEVTKLSTSQRYTAYSQIAQELNQIGQSVDTLATSPLLIDLSQDSTAALQSAFRQYQRFVSMANESAARELGDPALFLKEAQNHFNTFTLFSQQIFEALTLRAKERHDLSFDALTRSHSTTIWLGIAMMGVLISAAFFASWRINKRLMVVGDAILSLSKRRQPLPDFHAIEQMRQQHSGPLKRIASALIALKDAEQQRREAEQKIHRLAYYDTLTKLPNWRLMKEHLQHSLDTNQQASTFGALVYLGMDNFKRINDSSGHRVGDNLLKLIAQRLTDLQVEGATIGRLGGDEFMVILDGLAGEHLKAAEKAEALAEQIQHKLNQPFQLEGQEHFLSLSMGIALFNGPEHTVDNLFQYTNAAVHLAQKSGPNNIRFYDPKVQADLEARIELEHDMRLAIERDEFILVYQMQVDSLGRAIGAEALIRWQHPRHGFVSPGTFIPLAEETGLIMPIGNWVLETACEQLVIWANDENTQHLTLAVNVSAKQFQQPDFVDTVCGVLTKSGAPAHRLKLELTESTMIGEIDDIIARMHQLKALGVSFSLDDFGTGYSSLQYLKRLPLDQIKIDQSFVRNLHKDTDDKAIVQTIIAMGRSLGLQVIAEGVENQEHWRHLNEHQCHAFQGYYFCKPVSAAEMIQRSLAAPPMLA